MTESSSAIYVGHVIHKRLQPRRHAFRYRVFALCLDVDDISATASRLRMLQHNRWGLLSFHDRDHGRRDGQPVSAYIRGMLADRGYGDGVRRIMLICYPRVFGYVFNPLSVYVCYDAGDLPSVMVYEVTNTFGERTSYVIPVVKGRGDLIWQACAKSMYVSPFNTVDGDYGFHVRPPAAEIAVGVHVRGAAGPLVKTHFRGTRLALTDANLRHVLMRHPLMTVKVIAAIHFEALRLWLKRIPVVRHPPAARNTIIHTTPADSAGLHG